MELKDKLVTLRKEKGLTQLAVAEKLDISRQAISRWESGVALPSTDNLKSLSVLYGVPVDYLLNSDVEREHKIYLKKQQVGVEKITLAAIIACCIFFCFSSISRQRSVLETLHLEKEEILECSVSILNQGGVSTDLDAKEIEKIEEILDLTNIQFEKIESNMTVPVNTTKYMIFLQTIEGDTTKIVVSSDGYMFIGKKRYKIAYDSAPNIINHLKNILGE